MRLAAIDIGSNAVRLIVKEIRGERGSLKVRKLAHTRVPIRLGEDVFGFGSIGTEKERLLGQALEDTTTFPKKIGHGTTLGRSFRTLRLPPLPTKILWGPGCQVDN